MNRKTSDIRISASQGLLTPHQLHADYPMSAEDAEFITESRRTIESILTAQDKRILCIVGPCSVHDPGALLEFADQLKFGTSHLLDAIQPILRVYFEKPRSVVGWKGLINDPDLDGSFRIAKGLCMARELLINVTRMRLPVATEFLDTTFGQYYADLVSFGAIGARTVESQIHRELASGLSMPVGFKNATSGNIVVAADAILSARHPHWFVSITPEGEPAILESTGNPFSILILRGGAETGPNYFPSKIDEAIGMLEDRGLEPSVIVDCSHGNSEKQFERQIDVALNIADQIEKGQPAIKGIMMESNLVRGQQALTSSSLTYGQSITDACVDLKETLPVLERLAAAVRNGRLALD